MTDPLTALAALEAQATKAPFVQINTHSSRRVSQPIGYIVRADGCWEWTGARTPDGYGLMADGGKCRRSHVVIYTRAKGPVPDGLQLDHLCRNRGCVNPDHLEPVTNKVNSLRGEGFSAVNAKKTHCPAGHPYDEANTYRDKKGRKCWTCIRIYSKQRFA